MPSLEDRVSEEAVILCNEFIYHKLRQRGLINRGRQTGTIQASKMEVPLPFCYVRLFDI